MTSPLLRVVRSYRDVQIPVSQITADQASDTELDPLPDMAAFTDRYQRQGLWWALTITLRRHLLQYAGLGVIVVVVGTVLPIVLQRALEQGLAGRFVAATIAAIVAQSAVRWLSTWKIRVLVARTTFLVNRLLFRRLQQTSPDWLRSHERSTSAYLDTWPNQISQVVFAAEFAVYTLLMLAIGGYIAVLFGTTGLATLGLVVALTVVVQWLTARTARAMQAYYDAEHSRAGVIDTLVGAWQTVRRQSLEPQVLTSLARARTRQRAALRRRARLNAAGRGLTETLPVLIVVPVVVLSTGLNAGQGIALLVAVRLLLSALTANVDTYGELRTAVEARRGIDELFAADSTGVAPVPVEDGAAAMLVDGDRRYRFARGERIAVVATSTALAGRVLDNLAGLGGADRFAGSSAPGAALVARNQPTFDGTIAQVVTAFTGEVDEDRYRRALVVSGLVADLARFDDRDDTALSSSTVRLSEGELARLALAQALYLRPEVLLLDDVCAPFDPATVTRVTAGLLADGDELPLRIVATTDPEVIRATDRVVVVSDSGSAVFDTARLADDEIAEQAMRLLGHRLALTHASAPVVVPVPDWQVLRRHRFGTAVIAAQAMEDARGTAVSAAGMRSIQSLYQRGLVPVIAVLALLGWAAEVGVADRLSGSTITVASWTLWAAAAAGLAVTVLRVWITERAPIGQADRLHRLLLVRLLSGALDQRTASIGGRIGRDFSAVDVYAAVSNVAVAVAFLQAAAGLLAIVVITPVAGVPLAVIAVVGWRSHRRSRTLTADALAASAKIRAPGSNLAIAVIGVRAYHASAALREAIRARYDDLAGRRVVTLDRLTRVKLRALLEIEVVATAVPVVTLAAATLTGGGLRIALGALVYVSYSFVDRLVGIISQVQGTGGVLAAAGRLADVAGRTTLPERRELAAVPDTPQELYRQVVPGEPGSPVPGVVCTDLVIDLPNGRHVPRIDRTIGAGTFVAVTGPSGAGKSTLLRVLCGALAPAAGTVRVAGARPDWMSAATRAGTMLAESDLPLLPATVAELGAPTALLAEVCAAAGRPPISADMAIRGLSRGERQLVNLARVLAGPPPVLLLDEATSALTTGEERAVLALAKARMRAGTVLAILHRRDNQDLADEIMTIDTHADDRQPAGAIPEKVAP